MITSGSCFPLGTRGSAQGFCVGGCVTLDVDVDGAFAQGFCVGGCVTLDVDVDGAFDGDGGDVISLNGDNIGEYGGFATIDVAVDGPFDGDGGNVVSLNGDGGDLLDGGGDTSEDLVFDCAADFCVIF